MSEHKSLYRDLLIRSEQQSQSEFDKTIITLSSGALGVSFIFIKDVIGDDVVKNASQLLFSWIFLSTSLALILVSFYTSVLAHRKALEQFDADENIKVDIGGKYSTVTKACNVLSAVFLILGIVYITCFAYKNIGPIENKYDNKEITSPKACDSSTKPKR
jgi:hypothetical protein